MKNNARLFTIPFLFIVMMLGSLHSFAETFSFPAANKEIKVKEINDIPYYPEGDLSSELTKLNLLIPEGVENPPVFLWIGGGAWAYVNRKQEMDLCRAMARQGILMVAVGHRLSPALLVEPKRKEGIKHPEHIKDVAQAFKWIYQNSEKYGYSTKNLFVGGYSSGAHLSALLASDGSYLKNVGLSIENIKAIIPIAGAYDMKDYRTSIFEEDPVQIETHINAVFGEGLEGIEHASPINYIDQFNTPMLLVSESETYNYTVIYEQALKEKGRDNYVVLNCHNETHASLWKKLSWQEKCIYRDYIVDYILSMTE